MMRATAALFIFEIIKHNLVQNHELNRVRFGYNGRVVEIEALIKPKTIKMYLR